MKLEETARRLNRLIGDTLTWVTLTGLFAGFVFAVTRVKNVENQSDSEEVIWVLTATMLGCAAVFIYIMHSISMRHRRKNDELRTATANITDSVNKIAEMKNKLEQSLGTLPHDPAGRSDVQG